MESSNVDASPAPEKPLPELQLHPELQKCFKHARSTGRLGVRLVTYVEQLHQAIAQDLEIKQKCINVANVFRDERNILASSAFKLAKAGYWLHQGPQKKETPLLTDNEYRTYASAFINTKLGEFMSTKREQTPDNLAEIDKIFVEGILEIKTLGASDEICEDMLKNARDSLKVQVPDGRS